MKCRCCDYVHCCYNCIYCSETYPSLVDWCDMKNQRIKDVFAEHDCPLYIESEDESEDEKE